MGQGGIRHQHDFGAEILPWHVDWVVVLLITSQIWGKYLVFKCLLLVDMHVML